MAYNTNSGSTLNPPSRLFQDNLSHLEKASPYVGWITPQLGFQEKTCRKVPSFVLSIKQKGLVID